MNILKKAVAWVSLALVAISSVTAPAAPVPGDAAAPKEIPIPADAMVVIQTIGLKPFQAKVIKMAEVAAPDLAADLKKSWESQLKEILDDRDLSTLDQEGRIYLAVLDVAGLVEDPPAFTVLLPVPDYKAFREKFLTAAERKTLNRGGDGVDTFEDSTSGESVYLVEKKGYVAFTTNKDAASVYAGKFERLTLKDLGGLADAFNTTDFAVYINMNRITTVHGEKIQQFKQLFNIIIQQGGMGIDQRQLDVAKLVFQGLFQALDDGRGVVIGAMIKPEGVSLRIDAQFSPESVSAGAIGTGKPMPLGGIGTLPLGKSMYSSLLTQNGISGIFSKLNVEFGAAAEDDKSKENIEKYLTQMQKIEGESLTVAGDKGASLQVLMPKKPEDFAGTLNKVFKTLAKGASLNNVIIKAPPVLKEADQKFGAFTLTRATIEMDFDATVANVPDEDVRAATIASMKKITPEKLNVWFGTDGKQFVRVSAEKWDDAKALLEGYLGEGNKVGTDKVFLATRKQLPEQLSYLSVMEVGSLLVSISEYLSTMSQSIPGFPAELPKLEKPKGQAAAYLGISLTNTKDTARLDIFIPAAAVGIVRKSISQDR